MKRVLPPLLLLGLAGAGLSGCLFDGDDEPRTGAAYVAMGDSYTAGPYLGRPDGTDGCFRSTNNYPHLLAEEAGLDLTDVSCSAASTTAVTEGQPTTTRTVAPQLDAVGPTTRLVTIGLGGNDYNLLGRIITACVQVAASDPTGAPCTALDEAAGTERIASRLGDVRDNMIRVLQAIADKAPDARILVVGYPQVFPEGSKGCADLPLADGDLPLARRFNEGINAALAAAAKATGAEYVDVFAATDGHGICSADPWVAGSTVRDHGTPYHPYPAEQRAVARLLAGIVG